MSYAKHPFKVFIEVWLYFLLFILLQLLVLGPGRAYLWKVPADCYFQLLLFFIFTLLIYHRYNSSFRAYRYFMNIMVTFLLVYCFKVLFLDSGNISDLAIPNIFCLALGYWAGLLWIRQYKKWSVALLLAGLLIGTVYVTQFKYFSQFYSYRTVTGRVDEAIGTDSLVMTDRNGDTLRWEPDVYYVMDFWHTSCYACFRKMPDFNAYHERNTYKNVRYMLVNHPLNRDTLMMAFNILDEKGITVPGYTGTPNLSSQLGVVTYPTIIVLHNNKILFRGNPEPFADGNVIEKLVLK